MFNPTLRQIGSQVPSILLSTLFVGTLSHSFMRHVIVGNESTSEEKKLCTLVGRIAAAGHFIWNISHIIWWQKDPSMITPLESTLTAFESLIKTDKGFQRILAIIDLWKSKNS